MPSLARAEIQSGYRCTTTQTFTWPVEAPNGSKVEHTARITIESYNTDDYLAKVASAMAAWKSCRQILHRKFDDDWRQIGFAGAPYPGERRPLKICEDFYEKPELFTCVAVTRPVDLDQNSIVIIEKIILR